MDALLELHIRLPTPKTRNEKFSVFLDSKETGSREIPVFHGKYFRFSKNE